MVVKLLLRAAKLHLLREYISQEELAEDYDAVSFTYNETFRKGMMPYTEKLIEKLEINGKERIIDAGCGTGAITETIKGKWKNANIICVDISEEMLKKMQKIDGVEVYKKDVIEFLKNMDAKSVDIIVAAWSLSYVPHRPFLEETSRVLKKGGRIGIIVNKKDTLRETRKCIITSLREEPKMLKKLMRVYLPKDAASMAKLLDRCGFETTFMEDCEKRFEFGSSKEAVEFVFSTGALAGFMRSFDKKLKERLVDRHPPHVVHRFCIVVGKKLH